MNFRIAARVSAILLVALQACGRAAEAPRVAMVLTSDSSAVAPVTNDLGYMVELTEARAALEDFVFTIAGEAHTASLWRKVSNLFITAAHAHPGHFQAGDVTGELRGRYIVEWLPQGGAELGRATLLVGTYRSANFTFTRASVNDGLAADDALLGHTAFLRGSARRDSRSVEFVALLDSPEGRQLVGAPFELQVTEASAERLGVRLATRDPLEGDTLFDGLDFAALDGDGDGQVILAEDSGDATAVAAYNQLRRTFQTHDHFDVRAAPRD